MPGVKSTTLRPLRDTEAWTWQSVFRGSLSLERPDGREMARFDGPQDRVTWAGSVSITTAQRQSSV
jgi:hypothetical protein